MAPSLRKTPKICSSQRKSWDDGYINIKEGNACLICNIFLFHHSLYTSLIFDYSLSLTLNMSFRRSVSSCHRLRAVSPEFPSTCAQSSHWFRLALGQQRCKETVLTPCKPDFFLGVRLRKTHSQNSSFPDLSCSLPALSPEQAEFSPSACKLLFSAWLRSPPSYDTLGNCPLITTITICTHFIKLISLRTGFLHRTAQLEAHFFSSA